jgi:hypothetical protein
MKALTMIVLLFTAVLSYPQNTSKGELKKQKETNEFNNTAQLIDSMQYEFIADYALPQSGSSISLFSNPNFLKIEGDSVSCYMPFFGIAYKVSFNESGGFHFYGKHNEYTQTINKKKHKIEIEFIAKEKSDRLHFFLTISENKKATLSINSDNRAAISYWGEIKIINKEAIN